MLHANSNSQGGGLMGNQKVNSERWRRRHGVRPRIHPLGERLIEKRIISTSGCWLWDGATMKNGYASTTTGRRNHREYVHRIAYKLWVGLIPDGLEIDHLCRQRNCFNPKHLEAVTRSVNTLRGDGPKLLGSINGDKTHCKHGHLFDYVNTYFRPTGGRSCRACLQNRAKIRRVVD